MTNEIKKDYSKFNAKEVLKQVNKLINITNYCDCYAFGYVRGKGYPMRQIYKDLSIFDWWVNYLSLTRLKDMRKFLELAIELGFNGYVCFKVGAKYCANGMWAYKEESKDGYSPNNCDFIYKSFTPQYNYYQVKKNGFISPCNDDDYDSITTMKDFKKYYKKLTQ